jgi:hypothetical protein
MLEPFREVAWRLQKMADMQGKAAFGKSRKETHQRPSGLWRICQ